eukprot:RCo017834
MAHFQLEEKGIEKAVHGCLVLMTRELEKRLSQGHVKVPLDILRDRKTLATLPFSASLHKHIHECILFTHRQGMLGTDHVGTRASRGERGDRGEQGARGKKLAPLGGQVAFGLAAGEDPGTRATQLSLRGLPWGPGLPMGGPKGSLTGLSAGPETKMHGSSSGSGAGKVAARCSLRCWGRGARRIALTSEAVTGLQGRNEVPKLGSLGPESGREMLSREPSEASPHKASGRFGAEEAGRRSWVATDSFWSGARARTSRARGDCPGEPCKGCLGRRTSVRGELFEEIGVAGVWSRLGTTIEELCRERWGLPVRLRA